MKKYQSEVNQLIKQIVSQILEGKLTSKKAINQALARLSKDIKVPIAQLKVRLIEEAKVSATASAHSVVKQLMALNQQAVIKSMTATDISVMVDKIFNGLLPFKKIKNGKTIDYAIRVDDWFAYLGDDVVKKVKQGILGSYINGEHPAEVARNVLLNTDQNSKANRAKVKALTFTLVHKANEASNLQTFIDNERYVEWVKYQTAVDERVDDVCEHAELDSVQLKLKPSEYAKENMPIPSLHVFCRCYLKAMNGEDDTAKMIMNAKKRKLIVRYVDGVRVKGKCTPPKWLKSSKTISNIKKIVGKCRYSYKEYLGEGD